MTVKEADGEALLERADDLVALAGKIALIGGSIYILTEVIKPLAMAFIP